jgi:hypothetical protein
VKSTRNRTGAEAANDPQTIALVAATLAASVAERLTEGREPTHVPGLLVELYFDVRRRLEAAAAAAKPDASVFDPSVQERFSTPRSRPR